MGQFGAIKICQRDKDKKFVCVCNLVSEKDCACSDFDVYKKNQSVKCLEMIYFRE